jgi:FAD/FMN-containing dehydrogenase
VGGLTLGGGFGRLARRFGLACDNVRAIDAVTADGRIVRASPEENQDLFWGMRGGGGNFGVATGFEFQLHPVDPVMLGGELIYSFEDAPAMLKFFTEYATTQPDLLNVDAAIVRLPNDQRFMKLELCYSGKIADGEKVIAPLRTFRKPVHDAVAPTPYVALQSSSDVALAHGHRYYIKAGFVQKSSQGLIDTMVALIAESKAPFVTAISMPQGGGAIRRMRPKATAFAQRAADHNVFALSMWDDPALNEQAGSWTKSAWAKLEPHTRGFYVNEFNPDDANRIPVTYGENYGKLVELKNKFDPNNLFRMNANIEPTV